MNGGHVTMEEITLPSQNRLIAPGNIQDFASESKSQTHDPYPQVAPAFRFHPDQEPKLCKTDAEIKRLEEQGWVDKPWKVKRLPGWEDFYDVYQEYIAGGGSVKVSKDTIKLMVMQKRAGIAVITPRRQPAAPPSDKPEKFTTELGVGVESVPPAPPDDATKEMAAVGHVCTICGTSFEKYQGLVAHTRFKHKPEKLP